MSINQIAYYMWVTILHFIMGKKCFQKRKSCYKVISVSSYYLHFTFRFLFDDFCVMIYYIALMFISLKQFYKNW